MACGAAGDVLLHDAIHFFRARFLWNGACHEALRLWNYDRAPVALALTFDLDADFADIFEVRGTPRRRRGTLLEPVVSVNELRLGYQGLDGETRWTIVEWGEPPQSIARDIVRFVYHLEPQTPLLLSFSHSLRA
jgi:glycogen debranching enzyme